MSFDRHPLNFDRCPSSEDYHLSHSDRHLLPFAVVVAVVAASVDHLIVSLPQEGLWPMSVVCHLFADRFPSSVDRLLPSENRQPLPIVVAANECPWLFFALSAFSPSVLRPLL